MVRRSRVLAFSAVVLLACPLLVRAGDSWKDSLEAALKEAYPLSKRSALGGDRITKQGTVLVVKKDGITADLSTDTRYSITYVKDGQLSEQGGVMAAVFTKEKSRNFKVGEHVYVTDLDVNDDYVLFKVLSTDLSDVTVRGSTKQTRYKGAISFKFEKGQLASLDAAAVKAVVDPVFASEADMEAAHTKTIGLGQTRADVEGILGKPDRIVDLGAKVTYVYKDMKVIFVDGKVSDVQ